MKKLAPSSVNPSSHPRGRSEIKKSTDLLVTPESFLPSGWPQNVHRSWQRGQTQQSKREGNMKTGSNSPCGNSRADELPERIMCPEFTGSLERGWSQVVVRVSSLPHRQREEEKHLLHHREGNTSSNSR